MGVLALSRRQRFRRDRTVALRGDVLRRPNRLLARRPPLRPTMAPLIVTLALYDAGGLLSLAPWIDESDSVTFIAITIYITLTTVFFAAVVAARAGRAHGDDPARLRIRRPRRRAPRHPRLFRRRRPRAPISPSTTTPGRWVRSRTPTSSGRSLSPPIVWLPQDLLLRRGGACRAVVQADRSVAGVAAEFLARRRSSISSARRRPAARPHFPYRHGAA